MDIITNTLIAIVELWYTLTDLLGISCTPYVESSSVRDTAAC